MKNEDFLTGIYQNTSTALQSINDLYDKVKSANLKKILKEQEAKYKEYMCKTEELAHRYDLNLKDNNFFEKARLWTSVNIGSMSDNSARHLGEMMIIGTLMGMINCYKLMNEYKLCNEEIYALCNDLSLLEEKNFNEFKEYLSI